MANAIIDEVAADLTGTSLVRVNAPSSMATLADPGADRIMMWDESANAVAWLSLGTGLAITGTTLAIDSAVVTLTGTQTLTNKTLTAPTINAATITGIVTSSGVNTFSMTGKQAVAFVPSDYGPSQPSAGLRADHHYEFLGELNDGPEDGYNEGVVFIAAVSDSANAMGSAAQSEKAALYVRYQVLANTGTGTSTALGAVSMLSQCIVGAGFTAAVWGGLCGAIHVDNTAEGMLTGLEINIDNKGEAGGTGTSVVDGVQAKQGLFLSARAALVNHTRATVAIGMTNGYNASDSETEWDIVCHFRRFHSGCILIEKPDNTDAYGIRFLSPGDAGESAGLTGQGTYVGIIDAPNSIQIIRARNNADSAYLNLMSVTSGDLLILGSGVAQTNIQASTANVALFNSSGMTLTNRGALLMAEETGNGTNTISLRAPASVASSIIFSVPGVDGSANDVMITDGALAMSFATVTTYDILGGFSTQPSGTATTFASHIRGSNTTEADVSCPMAAAGTARNMYVECSAAPGSSETFIVTLRLGNAAGSLTNQALTVTISNTATTGNDTSNSVAFTAGQIYSVQVVGSSSAAASEVKVTFVYEMSAILT